MRFLHYRMGMPKHIIRILTRFDIEEHSGSDVEDELYLPEKKDWRNFNRPTSGLVYENSLYGTLSFKKTQPGAIQELAISQAGYRHIHPDSGASLTHEQLQSVINSKHVGYGAVTLPLVIDEITFVGSLIADMPAEKLTVLQSVRDHLAPLNASFEEPGTLKRWLQSRLERLFSISFEIRFCRLLPADSFTRQPRTGSGIHLVHRLPDTDDSWHSPWDPADETHLVYRDLRQLWTLLQSLTDTSGDDLVDVGKKVTLMATEMIEKACCPVFKEWLERLLTYTTKTLEVAVGGDSSMEDVDAMEGVAPDDGAEDPKSSPRMAVMACPDSAELTAAKEAKVAGDPFPATEAGTTRENPLEYDPANDDSVTFIKNKQAEAMGDNEDGVLATGEENPEAPADNAAGVPASGENNPVAPDDNAADVPATDEEKNPGAKKKKKKKKAGAKQVAKAKGRPKGSKNAVRFSVAEIKAQMKKQSLVKTGKWEDEVPKLLESKLLESASDFGRVELAIYDQYFTDKKEYTSEKIQYLLKTITPLMAKNGVVMIFGLGEEIAKLIAFFRANERWLKFNTCFKSVDPNWFSVVKTGTFSFQKSQFMVSNTEVAMIVYGKEWTQKTHKKVRHIYLYVYLYSLITIS